MNLADRIADTLTQHRLLREHLCAGCLWRGNDHTKHQAEMVAALVVDLYGPEF